MNAWCAARMPAPGRKPVWIICRVYIWGIYKKLYFADNIPDSNKVFSERRVWLGINSRLMQIPRGFSIKTSTCESVFLNCQCAYIIYAPWQFTNTEYVYVYVYVRRQLACDDDQRVHARMHATCTRLTLVLLMDDLRAKILYTHTHTQKQTHTHTHAHCGAIGV